MGPRWGNDYNVNLITMWMAVQRGWVPPENVSEAEYRAIRSDPNGDPALRAFVAFGCSWGGYGRHKAGDPTSGLSGASARDLLKKAPLLQGVTFTALSYEQMVIPCGSVIYCDPPFAGTTQYKDRIDHAAFWEWVRRQSASNQVFVSEFTAPPDFRCVLEFPRKNGLNRKDVVERLWTV
jgi:DNA adenine methylase